KTQDPESRTLPTVEIGRMSAKAEDVEAWLRAKVPALTGPFAGREWIKHVLREVTSIQGVA
ncbi:MAG: ISLre2 family transposase, partial [Bacillota bacterium]